MRREVAVGLRRLVEDAGQPYVVLRAARLGHGEVLLAFRSGEVLASRAGLLGLADRLDAASQVNARGVARARVFLSDATGPLYNPFADHRLDEAIWWIADGLQLSRRPTARGAQHPVRWG